MKALLVVGSDKTFRLASFYVKPLGFELIRYKQALKAMDNIDEVDPDAVIISASDFPRHWKTLVQFIRSERPKDKTIIIVLKGSNFPFEEAAKATHIEVNGLVSENLDDREELDKLQGILSRYSPVHEGRIAKRVRPADWDRLEFLFSRMDDLALVSGRLESISNTGLSFVPERPIQLEGLKKGDELNDCSLRVGDAILSPVCRIVRCDRSLALSFISFPEGEKVILETYLSERPVRERKRIG